MLTRMLLCEHLDGRAGFTVISGVRQVLIKECSDTWDYGVLVQELHMHYTMMMRG